MICPRLHAATPKKSWSSRFELEESISYTSNFRSCCSSNRYDICTFDAKSGSCVLSITSVRWYSTHLDSPNGWIYVTHIGSDFDNKSLPCSPLEMNKTCNKNQHVLIISVVFNCTMTFTRTLASLKKAPNASPARQSKFYFTSSFSSRTRSERGRHIYFPLKYLQLHYTPLLCNEWCLLFVRHIKLSLNILCSTSEIPMSKTNISHYILRNSISFVTSEQ